ncbi:hypothetical protein NFI96_011573 [Prochilodus magdalenae]|nr:hypothetical protein NFI96_011573 [Prochilodus magdalenae]
MMASSTPRRDLPPGVSVTCELGYSTLDCGDDVIQINSANYGRTDTTTCSALLGLFTLNTNCYAPDTFSIVSAWCNGRSKCTVEASYTIFTDPCFGTYKYLKIAYSCVD